ncbi:hypothetical protein Bca52824_008375 [Brassica carinata]|uniref:Uncharacterized protein n=1 Tax=Brassica carinata TaxID=52824 RepID=A0A8X8B950_BRACI|nr:hypothetical protein Bca52824_008375 [Brassica carinata]
MTTEDALEELINPRHISFGVVFALHQEKCLMWFRLYMNGSEYLSPTEHLHNIIASEIKSQYQHLLFGSLHAKPPCHTELEREEPVKKEGVGNSWGTTDDIKDTWAR